MILTIISEGTPKGRPSLLQKCTTGNDGLPVIARRQGYPSLPVMGYQQTALLRRNSKGSPTVRESQMQTTTPTGRQIELMKTEKFIYFIYT